MVRRRTFKDISNSAFQKYQVSFSKYKDQIKKLERNGFIYSIDIAKDSSLPLEFRICWLFYSGQLNDDEIAEFSIRVAEAVEYIYSKQYPNNIRIKDYIRAIRDYQEEEISAEDLEKHRWMADIIEKNAYDTVSKQSTNKNLWIVYYIIALVTSIGYSVTSGCGTILKYSINNIVKRTDNMLEPVLIKFVEESI